MSTTCEIEFRNCPEKVVYAGQTLFGTVHLTLTEEQIVRSVYIKIKGEAYARWHKNRFKIGQYRKIYSGEDVYYDEKIFLVGSRDGGSVQLTPGTNHYPFRCVLPAGLPSSVESECGHVRCSATVVIDIPMWPDKSFKEIFTVIKPINLNDDRGLREPVRAEIRKVFKTFGVPSDPLKIVVRVPVRGYTPGQCINLEIDVQNRSNVTVSKFLVKLIQKMTHRVLGNSNEYLTERSITQGSTSGCKMLQNKVIRANLQIPPLPPTNRESNIIDVEYVIRITASLGSFRTNPVLEIPITIGSIPIRDEIRSQTRNSIANSAPITRSNGAIRTPTAPLASYEDDQPEPSSSIVRHTSYDEDRAPVDQSNDAILTPTAPDYDPPTYEEAMSITHKKGENFKPKYPMFRRTTSYSIGN